MKRKKVLGIIGLLVLLDQSIKLYIKYNLMNKNFSIVGKFIRFKPLLNDAYSWVNSIFSLRINRMSHIIFVIIMIVLIYVAFKFVRIMYSKSQWIELSYIFIMSAAICSFIDKLFWGGSLDYIYFKGLFVYDLKDVYVTLFEFIVIGMLILNFRNIRDVSNKKLLCDFIYFLQQEVMKFRKTK